MSDSWVRKSLGWSFGTRKLDVGKRDRIGYRGKKSLWKSVEKRQSYARVKYLSWDTCFRSPKYLLGLCTFVGTHVELCSGSLSGTRLALVLGPVVRFVEVYVARCARADFQLGPVLGLVLGPLLMFVWVFVARCARWDSLPVVTRPGTRVGTRFDVRFSSCGSLRSHNAFYWKIRVWKKLVLS